MGGNLLTGDVGVLHRQVRQQLVIWFQEEEIVLHLFPPRQKRTQPFLIP